MRISYYPDTDTLYIELNERHGASTRHCANDTVIDVDANNEPIGIEIEQARKKTDLSRLKTKGLGHMRIIYDPVISIRDLLLDAEYPTVEPQAGTFFHVELGGNGESARIVSDRLNRQISNPGQELLR